MKPDIPALGPATGRGPAGLGPQHIAIVTDAWRPQVNGVVRTLAATREVLRRWGHSVSMISPDQFRSLPCPSYPEIRLAVTRPGIVARRLADLDPQAVHIATEGPLGLAARRYCLARNIPFTTAYHTQFPAYLARRTHLPESVFWPFIRWFHAPSQAVMVATPGIEDELRAQGISNIHRWSRGVDTALFSPAAPPPPEFAALPRPILLYVGRVAVEKNLEAFLSSSYPGTRVVVGDGPARAALAAAYPQAHFLGPRSGAQLAGCYAGADVFVFPSRTDTFGLVTIEALACGTPVAAYPVPGPQDIVTDRCGALSDNLDRAIAAASFCSPADCLARAAEFSWEAATRQFLSGLSPFAAELAAAA